MLVPYIAIDSTKAVEHHVHILVVKKFPLRWLARETYLLNEQFFFVCPEDSDVVFDQHAEVACLVTHLFENFKLLDQQGRDGLNQRFTAVLRLHLEQLVELGSVLLGLFAKVLVVLSDFH
jgi:hypothetical protein